MNGAGPAGRGALDPAGANVIIEVSGSGVMDHPQASAMARSLEAWLGQEDTVRRAMDAALSTNPLESLSGWDAMGQCLPGSGPVLSVRLEGVATAQSATFRVALADPQRLREGAHVGARALHDRMESTLVARAVGMGLRALGLREFARATRQRELADAHDQVCVHLALLALECGCELARRRVAETAMTATFSLGMPGVAGRHVFDPWVELAGLGVRVAARPRKGSLRP